MPKAGDADFVCAIEDVLEVYQRPYNSAHPLVCLDEATKQLVADVAPPQSMHRIQLGNEQIADDKPRPSLNR